jgi:hypothetical protein
MIQMRNRLYAGERFRRRFITQAPRKGGHRIARRWRPEHGHLPTRLQGERHKAGPDIAGGSGVRRRGGICGTSLRTRRKIAAFDAIEQVHGDPCSAAEFQVP